MSAHAVAGAGVAVQTEFARECSRLVQVRPACRQNPRAAFQIAASEIQFSDSVRGSALGFSSQNLLKRQPEIWTQSIAHLELKDASGLNAVRIQGVVFDVCAADVGRAADFVALVWLTSLTT